MGAGPFCYCRRGKTGNKEGKFWSPELHRFGDLKSPFHYAFYDKKGGSIVVEVENGKFHVYDNPTRVMTNGPAFPASDKSE